MKLRFAAAPIVALLLTAMLAAGQDAAENTQDEGVSEPPIKLVHVLNPGEREYLSPNLIGVQNIAMTFLPLTMNFINIIDAYREIVDGVRYEIHLNAVNTREHDADVICRLVILEKPWLTTQWGDKVRELQHSNCTSDADNLTDPAARSNALNDKYQSNAFFNGGSRNELSDDDMASLNAQIKERSDATKRFAATSSTSSTTTTSTTTEQPRQQHEGVTAAANVDAADETDEATTPLPELSDDEKKWLDDIFLVGAYNFETTRQEHKGQNAAPAPEKILNDGGADVVVDDDHQQQQAEELAATQFDDAHARAKRGADNLVGGVSEIDKEDAKNDLQASLDKLSAGDGPTYSIGEVLSASRQLISGTLTKIVADLIDADGQTARCVIEIWSRPWLPNGIEVTIECPDKDVVKSRHSRSVEYAEKKTHKKHDHHNLEKTEHLFNKFQSKYNRLYHSTIERQMRLRIFKQNLRTIEELNRNEMGSAKYGITEFADMTSAEYKLRTGLWQRAADGARKNAEAVIPNAELPKEFDWREKGAVSEVKNQGQCGSCWAFSVTGNIEGLHAVKTGKLEEYSEQELLDCDTEDSACNGGLPDNAYDAILKIGGLELESEYPYHGRKEQCQFNNDRVHVKVSGAVDLPKNETAIQQWLITNGPVSIGINANAMQFYRGGVSHPWRALCPKKNLDHGVLIVGYGVSDYPTLKKTLPYWIIKNSWGPKWGEQGYYRIYRGDNVCGVSEMASSAVLA